MQSIRSSVSRRAAQITAAPRTVAAQRPLSSSSQLRSAESHGDHYNPPGGWLFGVKPGEKYEKEGWENVWYWGFFGSMAFGVIGYCYKPDTRCVRQEERKADPNSHFCSIQTWALEEARRRLEAEGILQDPDLIKGDHSANTTE